jgi:hypothetical protein
MYVEMGVSVYDTSYDKKPENNLDKGHNGLSLLDID